MKTDYITLYSSTERQFAENEFEEALHHSMLQYSLQHLPMIEEIEQEKVMEALQKSILICSLAGVESKQHFKRRYIFDEDAATLHIDWLMSKKGLNVMVMQIPTMNETMARWLWELAEE
jgi:hypothetical protein